MLRTAIVLVFVLSASLIVASSASAQGAEWRPPSQQMPMMPTASELGGDWLGPRASWFNGIQGVTGVSASSLRAAGDARSGSDRAQIARFSDGPIPVVLWSDRNADGRADIIEIFRRGGVIVQLIDPDYDSNANVIRYYDASGELLREVRM
ncbi:MAG TPA: hypothetical protein VFI91_08500 [Longimicrobiaceae bacterium]|nr:hypothetical protein [Longimicrobiaceae bacterium]